MKTIARIAMKTQLLSRKLASRETMDSRRLGLRSRCGDPQQRLKNAMAVTST